MEKKEGIFESVEKAKEVLRKTFPEASEDKVNKAALHIITLIMIDILLHTSEVK